jgi:hypothetical protein
MEMEEVHRTVCQPPPRQGLEALRSAEAMPPGF